MQSLADLVSSRRLVSLVGRPGLGKTTLAARLARDAWRGEMAWVELRGVDDPTSAELAIAAALSEGVSPGLAQQAATGATRAAEARGRCLLVLDNAEHLLHPLGRFVLRLLDSAPRLHILVTSQTPLGLFGEEVLELSPLPEAGQLGLALFLHCIRKWQPAFAPSQAEDRRLGAWMTRLGGVPLAIEIAAASYANKPGASGLAGTSIDPVLSALGMLRPVERELLAQCATFRGCFDFEAIEAVVRFPADCGELPSLVAESLLDRGVLQLAPAGRLALCEGTRTRAYLLSDNHRGAERRHTSYFAALAEHFTVGEGVADQTATARLVRCRSDLEAALAVATEEERHAEVLVLCLGLDLASRGAGLTPPQLYCLDRALMTPPAEARRVARALSVRAAALRAVGKLTEALRDAKTALMLARELDEPQREAALLLAVGTTEFQLGNLGAAQARFDAALVSARESGNHALESHALQQLGAARQSLGDREAAEELYRAALGGAERSADEQGMMQACAGLGSFFLEYEDAAESERFYRRAMMLADRLKLARMKRILLAYLGVLCFDTDRLDEGLILLSEACAQSQRAGDARLEGLFRTFRAGLLATLDLDQEARADFTLGLSLLSENPFFSEVGRIYEGHLDLLAARQARGHELLSRSHVRLARARERRATAGDAGRSIAHRSDDARIALRILRRALKRAG